MGIAELYENTELTIQQIADAVGSSFKITYTFIRKHYTIEYRNVRKRKCYRNSRLGNLNPAYGKKGFDNPKFKNESLSDGKGYLLRLKPSWFTGRKGSKHIFEHHLVWCEFHNKTEIPKGFCIHHCDMNPLNNDASNLLCVSLRDHGKIHQHLLKGVTTISKESTTKWLEAHGRDWCL